MNEPSKPTPWWQTLPGILTGIAALVTALGGLFVSVYQSGIFDKSDRQPPAKTEINNTIDSSSRSETEPNESRHSTQDTETKSEQIVAVQSSKAIRVGHLTFKILDSNISPYAFGESGEPIKLSVQLKLRATDTMGVSNYIDGNTVRLGVDGAEVIPENSINIAVYDRQSVEIDALFIVPADYSHLDLLLGRPDFAEARTSLLERQ